MSVRPLVCPKRFLLAGKKGRRATYIAKTNLFPFPANPVDCGREGAEAIAHGSGCGNEKQRMPLHRPILRCSLQRSMSLVMKAPYYISFKSTVLSSKVCSASLSNHSPYICYRHISHWYLIITLLHWYHIITLLPHYHIDIDPTIPFGSIYSHDVDELKTIMSRVCKVWNTKTGKGSMNE